MIGYPYNYWKTAISLYQLNDNRIMRASSNSWYFISGAATFELRCP